jgi:RNA polymerase-binding protein DksA
MMQRAELESFKTQLQQLRDRLSGQLTQHSDEAMHAQGGEASGSLSNAPLHMADMGTDNFEQELSFSLLENEEQTLEEVNEALERIEQGSFGMCEECKQPVPKVRLQALPYARYCVECARKLEEGT